MTTCTGCTPTLFGNLALSGAGSLGTPISTQTITGFGQGAFSGVSGLPLGTINWYFSNATAGRCTGYSGQFSAVVNATGTTGLFTWNGSVFTCEGGSQCSSYISQRFIPNPNLSGVFPNYVIQFGFFDMYSNGTTSGVTAGQVLNTESIRFAADCGENRGLFNIYTLFIPGVNGYVQGESINTFLCSPCVSG